MTINYQVNYNGYASDVDDLFIRKDIFSTGGLWLWGSNGYGQLGDNTIVDKSSPVQTVSGGANWKQVFDGSRHTAAIKTDGTLWTWGRNNVGQLGDGTLVNKSSPVQVSGGGTNWKQVAAYEHTTAIKTDGTLWTWGYGSQGQLGINSTANTSTPVQVTGGGTNWKQVSGGNYHTAAIKTDGTLWTWGLNAQGQLGDNTTVNKSTPVQVTMGGVANTNWKQVSGGYRHTTAIKTDGTLWSWGWNNYGQLGDNTHVDKSTPVQISGGGTNWKQVSGILYHTAAIKTDGTLWSWGRNNYGQLGDNTIVNKSTPIQISGAGTNWKQVSGGFYHTTGIKTDGTLWSWGYNAQGELGINSTANTSTPVQVTGGGTNWKQVTCGQYHTTTIREDYY